MHDRQCDIPTQCHTFGPGVYGVLLQKSPIVWFNSFWGVVLPWDLLFKAQDSGRGYSIFFQLSSDCFHHCKHIALAMAGLQECNICQASSYLYFSHCPPYQRGFNLLAYLIAAHFTMMHNLSNSVHGQVHPSVTSPSTCYISFLMAWGVTGPQT